MKENSTVTAAEVGAAIMGFGLGLMVAISIVIAFQGGITIDRVANGYIVTDRYADNAYAITATSGPPTCQVFTRILEGIE